jgi:pyruvate kinase
MSIARTSHAAARLANGKVLVVGGAQTSAAELYDPAAGTFTATGSLTEVRLETDALIDLVEQELRANGAAGDGDHVIIVMGVPVGVGTPTNMIKFHSLPYLNKPASR